MRALVILFVSALLVSCETDENSNTINLSEITGTWDMIDLRLSKIISNGRDVTEILSGAYDLDELNNYDTYAFIFYENGFVDIVTEFDGQTDILNEVYSIQNNNLIIGGSEFEIIRLDRNLMTLRNDFILMFDPNNTDDIQVLVDWEFRKR